MFSKKVIWSVLLISAFLIVGIGCAQKKNVDTIVIWHWMMDRQDAFSELAQKYKEKTGTTVEFKLFFPPDIYSQKVIAAARAGGLPDIFGILGERKTLASFIKAGHMVNITSFMEENGREWKKRFYPQTLELVVFSDTNTYDVSPGIYGVPIDTTIMQFIYNRSLFKGAGLDPDTPPETFGDFITYAQSAQKALGVNGFVCGWGEGWLLNALAVEWAINTMGEERFLKTIDGQIPYTDREWIKVFSLFQTLKESGILASNIATMTNKESEDAFSKGKAVFSFNGSWAVNVYAQLAPELDYAFFPLPKVSQEHPIKVWGGAGSSFMVNAKSFHKEKAIQFLKWLTSKEQQEFFIRKTNNLPAIRECEDALSPLLKSLLSKFGNLTHPDTWERNEDSRVIEVMNRGLQQIVMGVKSPQEVAGEIQRTKERVSRR